MRAGFKPDPNQEMLDRFNRSEAERLLPVWRRAGFRLQLTMFVLMVVVLWACAIFREAH